MKSAQRKAINDEVVLRITRTLELKGIKQSTLINHLGLSEGMFATWKYNNGKSYLKYLDEIADFLGVSKDYLLHGTVEDQRFLRSQKAKRLLERIMLLSDSEQEVILSMTEALLSAQHAS